MSLHSYNHGIVTSMKGPAIEAFRVTGMNASPCTVADQCKANLVSAVTIAAGVVTVQLNQPYPPAVVACFTQYGSASATDDIIVARPREAGYTASTGQLVIDLSNDDDVAEPVAASPGAADELHVMVVFRRYTT